MVFSYYNRLSKKQKQIYRASDVIHAIRLPTTRGLKGRVKKIESALKNEKRVETEIACRELIRYLISILDVPPVRIKVFAARPHDDWGELHGLYTPSEGRKQALIHVWMRTAKKRKVVAFRSFLRTVLHELCHHLDYEYLKLEDSLHTEGFYKRESSLFHQLVPAKRKTDKK